MRDALNDPRPSVLIDTGDDTGLILLAPSGIFYSNQAGDIACEHPVEEGAFVVFHRTPVDSNAGFCWPDNGVQDPDVIDRELAARRIPARVDRDRLNDSMEAWVYCRTMPVDPAYGNGYLHWPADMPCVLVYMNCD